MCTFHVAFGGHWHTFPPIHYSPARRVRPELKARPLTSPRPCYECGHLWLDGGSLLWNPSPHVVSMWKKWGTVRLQQRERNAHTYTHRRTVTHSAGIFLPLAPHSDEQWLLVVFGFWLFFQHWMKDYLGIIVRWHSGGFFLFKHSSGPTQWTRHCAHVLLDYRTLFCWIFHHEPCW